MLIVLIVIRPQITIINFLVCLIFVASIWREGIIVPLDRRFVAYPGPGGAGIDEAAGVYEGAGVYKAAGVYEAAEVTVKTRVSG